MRLWCAAVVAWAVGCDEASEGPPCAIGELTQRVAVSNIDRTDVLFVIDNSEAMAAHRPLLEQELPQMIERLVTGFLPRDGQGPTSGRDVRIGFVSTDMGDGVVEDEEDACSERGDEGALHVGASCAAQETPFVWHFDGYHDADTSIASASCNAIFEPGCTIAQPLESALSALSQSDRFLRSSADDGLSLIVVVFVAAQDDCSLARALGERPIAARCATDAELTQPVDRYVEALRALRPGNETLLRTLTIAGVPQDLLVTAEGEARDPRWDYPMTEQLLADPRMQVQLADDGASLAPACTRGQAAATPARRLVELAGRLHPGRPQVLHSICAEGWADALEQVIVGEVAPRSIGAPCLSREIARDGDGLTACRMYWTLPEWFDPAQPLTPAHCDDRAFLRSVEREPAASSPAGAVCEVRQVSATQDAAGFHLGSGEGFYIDDGSDEALQSCPHELPMIAFTEDARPPHGVSVEIVCSDDAQRYREPDAGLHEPSIGDPCHARRLRSGGELVEGDARCESESDPLLICSPESNVCVRTCAREDQCPPGWLCDAPGPTSAPGDGVCVNPSCEAPTPAAAGR